MKKRKDPKPSECTCIDLITGKPCKSLASMGMFAATAHSSKCPFFKEWMKRYIELMDEFDPSRKAFRESIKGILVDMVQS